MWLIRTIRGASRVFVFPLFLALALVAPKAYATNLLSNSDFEFDTSGWEEPFPDGNVIISHDTAFDHDSTPGVVGSLKLDISIDNGGARGPWQCVQVSPETLYSAAASVRRPTQSPVPFPSVELRYYSDASCTDFQGFHTGGSTHLPDGIFDEWFDIAFETTTFPGTRSATFRLLSGGTIDPAFTTVYFDSVFLPEPGSLLSGTVAAVTVFLLLACLRGPDSARRRGPESVGVAL